MKVGLSNFACIIMLVLVFIFGCQPEQQISTGQAEPQTVVKSEPSVETEAQAVEKVTPVETEKKTAQEIIEDSNIVVTVNGTVITNAQLQKEVKPILDYRDSINQKTTPSLLERYESQRLDGLITNLLKEEQMKANNIVVTGEDVNSFIVKMIKSSDPNMTMEEMKSLMEARGTDFEQWKEAVHQRLRLERLLEVKYPGQTDVSEEEAKKFYDENQRYFKKPEMVRASHILIEPGTSDPNKIEQAKAAAKQKAQGILKQIRDGADFAEMAKTYSDGPSAKNGGDLGFKSRGQWIPAFSDAAFSLKTGEISDVVETSFGYHIITVTGQQDAVIVPFEQAEDSIINALKSRKQQQLIPELIKKWKEDADIVYPPGSTLRAYQPRKSTIRKPPVNLLKPSGRTNTEPADSGNQ